MPFSLSLVTADVTIETAPSTIAGEGCVRIREAYDTGKRMAEHTVSGFNESVGLLSNEHARRDLGRILKVGELVGDHSGPCSFALLLQQTHQKRRYLSALGLQRLPRTAFVWVHRAHSLQHCHGLELNVVDVVYDVCPLWCARDQEKEQHFSRERVVAQQEGLLG